MRKVIVLLALSIISLFITQCSVRRASDGIFSSDHTADNRTAEPYSPTSTSTWGDLYRHFDPQGFEELPKEMQDQLDSLLLEDTGENHTPSAEITIGDRTIITTQGYLYPKGS